MNPHASSVRIAVLQGAVATGDSAANLAQVRSAARRAVEGGAELLITPEMFISGYNLGDRVAALAAEPLLDAVAEIARTEGIAIVAGLPLPSADGITNSAVFVDKAGELLGRYDKTHLFGDLDRSMFTAGTELAPLIEWSGLRVGLLICYDVEFPETVRTLALAGADLIAVPTAQMKPFEFVAEHVLPARAWESQVYIAYADHVGAEGELEYVGRSSVSTPDGQRPQLASSDEPALLIADVDTARLAASRADNPYLHDRRTELYAAGGDSPRNPETSPSA